MKNSLTAKFLSAAILLTCLQAHADTKTPQPPTDPTPCALPDTTGKLSACLQAVGSSIEDAANSDVLNDQLAAIAEENPRLYIEIITALESVAQDDVMCQSLPGLQEKLERALNEEDPQTGLSADFQAQAHTVLNARADCAQQYATILQARPQTRPLAENFVLLSQSQRLLAKIVAAIKIAP